VDRYRESTKGSCGGLYFRDARTCGIEVNWINKDTRTLLVTKGRKGFLFRFLCMNRVLFYDSKIRSCVEALGQGHMCSIQVFELHTTKVMYSEVSLGERQGESAGFMH
jgi:hypothetical protein